MAHSSITYLSPCNENNKFQNKPCAHGTILHAYPFQFSRKVSLQKTAICTWVVFAVRFARNTGNIACKNIPSAYGLFWCYEIQVICVYFACQNMPSANGMFWHGLNPIIIHSEMCYVTSLCHNLIKLASSKL